MAYQKKYATDEERRLAQAAGGRKGALALKASGNYRGGRPKGSKNKNSLGATPTQNLMLRVSAYNTFTRCASTANMTLIDFMSLVADGLRKKNPILFDPKDEVQV